MRIVLYEDNLMWSVRTKNGLQAMGHEVTVLNKPTEDVAEVDLAIVNLGAKSFDAFELASRLKQRGVRTLGHVGHKEKDLWQKGIEAGCTKVVSNGSLANRLVAVISELQIPQDS